MKSIDKLRELLDAEIGEARPYFKGVAICDEIEMEIAERYMLMPVDAGGVPIQPRIIDGMGGWPEIYIEGENLIFANGNDECVFNASYCPMCGRRLGGDME